MKNAWEAALASHQTQGPYPDGVTVAEPLEGASDEIPPDVDRSVAPEGASVVVDAAKVAELLNAQE